MTLFQRLSHHLLFPKKASSNNNVNPSTKRAILSSVAPIQNLNHVYFLFVLIVLFAEEASHDTRPKIRKGSLRRLRKRYQVESDDDGCCGEKIIGNDRMHAQIQETDNEDSLPISSLYKNKASGRVVDEEMDVSVVIGAGAASNKNGEDGGNSTFETNLEAGHVLLDSQTHR